MFTPLSPEVLTTATFYVYTTIAQRRAVIAAIVIISPLAAMTPSVFYGAVWSCNNAMAFIPAVNTGKFELVYNDIGQVTENVFHIQFGGAIDTADLIAMCAALVNWWDINMQPITSVGAQLTKIIARDLTTAGGVGIEYTTGLPLSGTGTSALTSSVTVATKLSTGFTGRSFRGRSYFIGMPADALSADPNVISTTFASAVDAAFEALIGAIVAEGAKLVVASFFSDLAPRPTAVLTEVIAASVDRFVDSQRRRLTGRGS